MLLAGDTAPIDALCVALAVRGLAAVPLIVTSLKDTEAAAFLRNAFGRLGPVAIVTMTGFAAGNAGDAVSALDCPRRSGVPGGERHDQARRLGKIVRAGWAPPIWPCTWCFPNSMAACLAGAVAFKDTLAPSENSLSPRLPAAPKLIASTSSRTALPRG